MKDHTPSLPELVRDNQRTLHAKLTRARKTGSHNPTKGSMSESAWREILAQHLPRRYRVSHGFVVDSRGGVSLQNDIIIHDTHYCPTLLLEEHEEGACFVLAESVYAVFEAKQAVTAHYLAEAGRKAASVRSLCRTSARIVDRGVACDPRDIPPILAGIVALECDWSDGFGEAFVENLSKLERDQFLDLGCALDAGAFETNFTGDGAEVALSRWSPEDAFPGFLFRLLQRLRDLGTAPAIDWSGYAGSTLAPDPSVYQRKPE